MHHVVTLLAPSNTPCPVEEALNLLGEHGVGIARAGWVEKLLAYDMVLDAPLREDVRGELLHDAQDHWHIDVIVQPLEGREKKLIISDMDSTMICEECIDELADMVGKKTEVAAITERAMRGELDFAEALRARVSMLKGLPEGVLQRVLDERITLSKGARALVQTMNARGAHSVLVSGGFTFFTSAVAEKIGFADQAGNVLEIQNGLLTGEVRTPILDKFSKEKTLRETCAARGVSPHDVLALGDGANDIPMLQAAGLGVAYRAKEAVRASAQAQLNYCDLSYLLYAQGIAKAQWVA